MFDVIFLNPYRHELVEGYGLEPQRVLQYWQTIAPPYLWEREEKASFLS